MNCKKGDLAIVVRARGMPECLGRLVNVLRQPPYNRNFNLPDGFPHMKVTSLDSWIIEFIGEPVLAEHFIMGVSQGKRSTFYGCCGDSALRPIRDGEGDDETLAWAKKPEKVTA